MRIGDWCVGGEAESVWGPGPVFLGMFPVMELPSCCWPVRPFSSVYHRPMTLLTLLEDLKAPPEMKGVSDTSQSLLDGGMGSARELSNFPADLSARNIPLWACFSLNRILLDRSGPGSCPGVLGSVEEGPHTLLAVRNGLADHWSIWVPLIPQPHMGLPRIDPKDSVTLYPNSTVNCIGSFSSPVGRMLRTFSRP